MKKLIIVLLSLVMAVSLSACSGGSEAEPEEGSEQTVAESVFTGNYVVSADYVKENLDNILLYDARGEEAAAEGTIAQAVPVAWQYFATCEDGATGDANWGCILDPERLSARLGEKGFDKDKEIVIFAAADQGWGDDGRIAWELIAAGYTNVKIVDGGYNALVAAGLETSNGGAEPVPVESDDRVDRPDTCYQYR